MGRILFPPSGEAFGYSRMRTDQAPTDGMAHYGPGEIAQALVVAETASEHFAKPVARGLLHLRQPQHGTPVNDQWVADRQAQGIPLTDAQAKPGALQQETPLPPTLVRRPVIAGSPGVPRHEDVVAYERAMQAQAQAQAQAAAAAQQAPAQAQQAQQGAQPPAQVHGSPQAGGGAAQPGDSERLAKLKDTMAVVNDTLASGRPMTPRAKQRIAQIQAEIQALEARLSPQQPNLNPQATLATQKDGTVVATPQDPYLPGMGQPVANRADAQAAALRPNEYQLNVQADRKHSLPELQALIQAAKATGRQEDLAAAQQAILSAPLDDAEPTDWVDIFTEFAGGQGFHREKQRQALLKELAPPAHGGLDSWRIANIESQINRRAAQDDYTREMELRAAIRNQYEQDRQALDVQQRGQNVQKAQLDVAGARFKPGTEQAKQGIARADASTRDQMNRSKIGLNRALATQAKWTGESRALHDEHPEMLKRYPGYTDPHRPIAGGGGGLKVEQGFVSDTIKRAQDAGDALQAEFETAQRPVLNFIQHLQTTSKADPEGARQASRKDRIEVNAAVDKMKANMVKMRQNIDALTTVANENPMYRDSAMGVIQALDERYAEIKKKYDEVTAKLNQRK